MADNDEQTIERGRDQLALLRITLSRLDVAASKIALSTTAPELCKFAGSVDVSGKSDLGRSSNLVFSGATLGTLQLLAACLRTAYSDSPAWEFGTLSTELSRIRRSTTSIWRRSDTELISVRARVRAYPITPHLSFT